MKIQDIDFIDKIKLYGATIIVIMVFVSSLTSYFHFERVHQNGVYTSAVITAITSVRYDDNNRPLTFGNAVYYDDEHQSHTYNGYLGIGMTEGDTIELLYDRNRPEEVLRNTGSSTFLAVAICFGILSAALTILSLKALQKNHRNSQPKYDFDY